MRRGAVASILPATEVARTSAGPPMERLSWYRAAMSTWLPADECGERIDGAAPEYGGLFQ